MHVPVSQELALVVLFTAALIGAIPSQAQTAPTPAPSTATPTSPTAAAKPTPPEELQWSEFGATAQCRDGTFFHGEHSARTCADHGGVRKWLQGPEQTLIR
jgi:hypothetical protein